MAKRFGLDHHTVALWVSRAQGERLDRVVWADRPCGRPPGVGAVARELEDVVLKVRRELSDESILGERGAASIHRHLVESGVVPPSVRTIGRILERRGVLDAKRRVRRVPPPRGWYLPEVASRELELDAMDTIEALSMGAGSGFDVLTAISLHGGLPGAWPMWPGVRAKTIIPALQAHWRTHGLPGYAQFDNDRRFQGLHPKAFGRVTRLCLSLGVTVVFAPIREHGIQSLIESFNGLWRAKVWDRVHYDAPPALEQRNEDYLKALRKKRALRIADAPPRRTFPSDWHLDLQTAPSGRVVFIRRTSEHGIASVLGQRHPMGEHWCHRLVRCEAELATGRLRFYALRRADPTWQPILLETSFTPPRAGFHE